MRHTLRALLACVLWLGASRADATSFIWTATSPAGKVVYLVGSVHILNASYYPLAPEYDRAFDASDLLVEELDMGEMLDPAQQMKMLTRGRLPAGQSLDRQLRSQTITAVTKALDTLGLPFEPLKQFKAWMLAVTIQQTAWQKAGFDGQYGLDLHFYQRAQVARKPVQGLETLDYQLSRFDGMSPDLQERLLADTVAQISTTRETFTRMADAWRQGDAATLETLALDELSEEPEMYDRLLLQRNLAWLPQLEALFTRERPAMVVVGAAHLVGRDGLLRMLRDRGYTITQQ